MQLHRRKAEESMMKRMTKKRGWLVVCGVVLAAGLVLCAWIFGWGRGDINVMEFSADAVDHIELYCTVPRLGLHKAAVTEKDDIQALIHSINSFSHTGNAIKEILKGSIMSGGSTLYTFYVYFLNGEDLQLTFASNSGEQEISNMEVMYWIGQENNSKRIPNTCRGSMELFYELYTSCPTAE